jgi:hypothetical protein
VRVDCSALGQARGRRGWVPDGGCDEAPSLPVEGGGWGAVRAGIADVRRPMLLFGGCCGMGTGQKPRERDPPLPTKPQVQWRP